MAERRSYKTTLFDREGPDAGIRIRAYSYAAFAGGVSIPMFVAFGLFWELSPARFLALVVLGPIVLTVMWAMASLRATGAVEVAGHAILAGTNSTPYIEQYSYQQALVMQGRLAEALESYEAIIAEPDSALDVRIRAAELYTREAKRHDRAAELLQAVLRDPRCAPNEEVYAANRLADLQSAYLGQPGRALVTLRRIADRYAGTPVGDRAREAIRAMKALPQRDDQAAPGPAVGME